MWQCQLLYLVNLRFPEDEQGFPLCPKRCSIFLLHFILSFSSSTRIRCSYLPFRSTDFGLIVLVDFVTVLFPFIVLFSQTMDYPFNIHNKINSHYFILKIKGIWCQRVSDNTNHSHQSIFLSYHFSDTTTQDILQKAFIDK